MRNRPHLKSAFYAIGFADRGCLFFFFSSRRRHTRSDRDWSSDVCSSDLAAEQGRRESELVEQLAAAKAAVEQTEAVCREETQRSSRFEEELIGLRQLRDRKSVV